MSDILERLRGDTASNYPVGYLRWHMKRFPGLTQRERDLVALIDEAANEIERLRAAAPVSEGRP